MTISILDVIIHSRISSIDKKEGEIIAREQLQTLSEPMYYILLALRQECCGVDIMHRVDEISGGRIAVGPGTLYALLEKFLKNGFIRETKVEGRKRSYIITGDGEQSLYREYQRLATMVEEGRGILYGEE